MNINELPDVCLLTTFNFFNDLSNLNNFSKVCVKWRNCARERLRRVRYLHVKNHAEVREIDGFIYADEYDTLLKVNMPETFPNLKFIFFDFNYKSKKQFVEKRIIDAIAPLETIRGLVFNVPFSTVYSEPTIRKNPEVFSMYGNIDPDFRNEGYVKELSICNIPLHQVCLADFPNLKRLEYFVCDDENIDFTFCKNLDMVLMRGHINDYFKIGNRGDQITQLCLRKISSFTLETVNKFFPNLKRLQVDNSELGDDTPFNSPVTVNHENLEIFEQFSQSAGGFYEFPFIDYFPSLKSAFLAEGILPRPKVTCYTLQDLVIVIGTAYIYDQFDWQSVRRILLQYPNLKHLALRCLIGELQECHRTEREENEEDEESDVDGELIEDRHIEEIVQILPKLVLLDVRTLRRVTQRSVEYVQNYCKTTGRRLKIYIPGDDTKIRQDWPDAKFEFSLIEKGWDFMKNVFFKDDEEIPIFLE